jgi:hypothetical protein
MDKDKYVITIENNNYRILHNNYNSITRCNKHVLKIYPRNVRINQHQKIILVIYYIQRLNQKTIILSIYFTKHYKH